MKRNIYTVLILTLVLGLFAAPALAVDAVATRLSNDWVYIAAAETVYFPPGNATDTAKVIVGQPYAGFWLFGVTDTWGATPVFLHKFQYRLRVKYPGTTSAYWTAWTASALRLGTTDALTYAPIWANDTCGWFDDIQVRRVDSAVAKNESTKVRLWVVKR